MVTWIIRTRRTYVHEEDYEIRANSAEEAREIGYNILRGDYTNSRKNNDGGLHQTCETVIVIGR